MAYFIQPSVVNYACSCGNLKPITKIYFCRHCLKTRCGFCVCHEVDSHYCANCLENIPTSEARLRKNRCASCFDCPCCFHTISTRATNVALPSSAKVDGSKERESKPITRKMYYFSCFSCRWTSRDVGIPDQTVATGSWPERENVHAHRVARLQEYFNLMALREKQEKQENTRKKFSTRGKFTSLTDKIGMTAAMLRVKVGLPETTPGVVPGVTKVIPPAIATDEVEELPTNIFTKELNLNNVTTLPQRFIQPENQATVVNQLFPQHKCLSVKQSLRCRQCEHNVIKPEYNPGSIKFKIHLFAYFHVPEVRFVTCEPMAAGKPSLLIIKLSNPTIHETTISLLPLTYNRDTSVFLGDIKAAGDEVTTIAKDSSSLSRQGSVTFSEDPRHFVCPATGEVDLPNNEITVVLPKYDAVAEYDDEVENYDDDPKLVVWRKANRVGLQIPIVPHATLQLGDNVVIGFIMKYSYVNTINQPEKQKYELFSKVYVTLGKVQGSS